MAGRVESYEPAGHRLEPSIGSICNWSVSLVFARACAMVSTAVLTITCAGPIAAQAVHVAEPTQEEYLQDSAPATLGQGESAQLPLVEAVVQRDPLIDEEAAAVVSHDGRFGAVAGRRAEAGMVVLWDLKDRRIIRTFVLREASGELGHLSFNADDTGLVLQESIPETGDDSDLQCELLRWSVDLMTGQARHTVLAVISKYTASDLQREKCRQRDWGRFSQPEPHDDRRATLTKLQGEPLRLLGGPGQTPRTLSFATQPTFAEAIISPDAHRLLLVDWRDRRRALHDGRVALTEEIRTFDLESMRFLSAANIPPFDYGQVTWVDPDHYVVNFANSDEPTLVIDAKSGSTSQTIPSRCYVQPNGSKFYGAGLGECTDSHSNDRGLAVYEPASGWRKLDIPALRGRRILAFAVSADGEQATAIVESRRSQEPGHVAIIIDLGRLRQLRSATYGDIEATPRVSYLADGRIAIDEEGVGDGPRVVWRPGEPTPYDVHPERIATQAKSLYADALIDGSVTLRQHDNDGNALATNVCSGTISDTQLALRDYLGTTAMSDVGRFMADGSDETGVQIYDMRRCKLILTLHFFTGDRFFAKTPAGRYDTNLRPDTDLLRWVVRDAPLVSVSPQAFMRQYYEPDLARRMIDCNTAASCGREFKRVPDVLSLNRVLPRIRNLVVRDGPTPATALVDITADPITDSTAPNRKTKSGLYNLRLFRANALVAEWKNPAPSPAAPGAEPDVLDAWRIANALPIGSDGAFHASAVVRLPTGTTARDVAFSAYAFNEDRVKSDTFTTRRRVPPFATPRPRRAFVLAVGINRYNAEGLQLKYAAQDATLFAQRLGTLPGYDVRTLTLAGADSLVTKALIEAALALLAAPPSESAQATASRRTAALATLSAAGIDGKAFKPATPDDLVVMSYSGHGWTDPVGNFFMLPADTQWLPTGPPADHASLIGAEELADWLEAIDAGDMALVIDACHSAASVAAGGFKPGPMGDAGLGQLAYDKGIRIIAASQSDDVAFEDARLQHGLLTYALAEKGLDDKGFGAADLDHDRRIMLDEWLRYAVAELPPLSSAMRRRHITKGFGVGPRRVTVIRDSQSEPKPQMPALFDFHSAPSTVMLRRGVTP